MRNVLTPREMSQMDSYTISETGVPAVVLMERAALAVAIQVKDSQPGGVALVACGPGNNGGDGLAVARILHLWGYQVSCFVPSWDYKDAAAATNYAAARRSNVPLIYDIFELEKALPHVSVIIDALFGTGLDRMVSGQWLEAIKLINASCKTVLAVDIPSGIDGATGQVMGAAVRADSTVTFQYAKVGHCLYPGRAHTGKLAIADIGIADGSKLFPGMQPLYAPRQVLDYADAAYAPRRADSHKGDYGHVSVIAGSMGMAGAGVLCVRAAMRGGAGLATWVLPESIAIAASAQVAEAMIQPLPCEDGSLSLRSAESLLEALKGKTVAVIGPGLSRKVGTVALLRNILPSIDIPMIIDADALIAISGYPEALRGKQCVLTPHPGEMARLMAVDTAEVTADPMGMAQRCAERYGAVVVLKGSTSIIARPDGAVTLNLTGNPGMATGGSGDVLAGLIGALVAQGAPLYEAARSACWLHGKAGDIAANRLGMAHMLAGDIIDSLPAASAAGGERAD